jgi:hypothetical protein
MYGFDVDVPLHGDPPIAKREYVDPVLYELVEWFSTHPPKCRFVKIILRQTVQSDEA